MIIQSKLLSAFPELRFGMSTRQGGVSPEPLGMNLSFSVGDERENVIINRQRFAEALDIDTEALAMPRQEHTDVVKHVMFPGIYNSCDGLVTKSPGVFLVVSIADCQPIFLYDPVEQAVGAVHAGWRGSKERILSRAVEKMAAEFGSRPGSLRAYLGPSAGVCCYEVGEEVAAEFPASAVQREPGKKPRLDLKRFNSDLLKEAGVAPHNIEISGYCTICSPEYFHSYRREGDRSGRMWGIIGITG